MLINKISHSLVSFFLLLWSYFYFIVPIFGYTGFIWDFSYVKFIESVILVIITDYVLPRRCDKPSDFLLNIHYLLPILPMLVLYAGSNQSRIFMYSVILFFYMIIVLRNFNFPTLKVRKFNQNFLKNLLIFICFLYLGLLFYYNRFDLNFNFFNVYLYRIEYSEKLPFFFNYLSPLVSKVFLPIAIFLCLSYKNRFLFVALLVCAFLIFGYTQHKATFFYPLFVITLYAIVKSKNIIYQLKFFYLLLVIACLILFTFNDDIILYISSILYRRFLLVPADLNFQYFEYFTSYPNVYWAKNFFTFGLIDYPYDIPTANIMGEFVSGKYQNYANTGWIGSGFMHFHYIGLFIYSIIISYIMSILDALSKQINTPLVIAFTTIPVLTMFVSSDLPTTLLTHGLIISIIITMCISNNEK